MNNFRVSYLARAYKSLQVSEPVSEAFGVSVQKYKSFIFVASSVLCVLSGILFGLNTGHVAPEAFQIHLSLFLLVGIVVGGIQSPIGAIIGALFLQLVPGYAEEIHKSLTGAVFGSFVVITILWFPNGIGGAIEYWWNHFRTKSQNLEKPKVILKEAKDQAA